jgi:hypothetical protein
MFPASKRYHRSVFPLYQNKVIDAKPAPKTVQTVQKILKPFRVSRPAKQ